MNKLNFISLLFVFAFCVEPVRSQFCGETVKFSLIDKKGKSILNNKVKIKEKSDTSVYSRIYYDRDKPTENVTSFKFGCTSGGIVSIIYKGSEMRINFKFRDSPGAVGKITFQKGDFIAEPEKAEFGRAGTEIRIRKATDEELK